MMEQVFTVGFIGSGNMARALIGGLLGSGVAASAIFATDANIEVQQALCASLAVRPLATATKPCSALVVAVKPADVKAALGASGRFIGATTVVVSIAAGIPTRALSRWLPQPTALVRAMPNTPAIIGAGISGAFATGTTSAEQRTLAERILAAAGPVLWFDDEIALDAVTAVSGSGPAYLFYLIEAMEAAALAEGLGSADARRLAIATCAGAARLAEQSDQAPARLREQVTSKGGTTAAALDSFQRDGFIDMVKRAVHAARERARDMGEEYGAG